MILVNKNFGNPVLAEVIGDMFKGSSNTGMNVDWVPNSNTLATNSSLVSGLANIYYYVPTSSGSGGYPTAAASIAGGVAKTDSFNNYQPNCQNFYIVTEHFLKTLDKVYTKIWNESFTETGIYAPANIATLFHGFVTDTSAGSTSTDFMMFKKFVDRCITAGILLEEDRLDYKDQIFISGMSRSNMSTQVDTTNRVITLTHSTPIDISPDIDTQAGQYLNGKKLYLLMTPYLTNESVIKGYNNTTQEPFSQSCYVAYDTTQDSGGGVVTTLNTPVKRPLAFFKPKTNASKFGRSLPLATHLIWSIGTPADEAAALANGTTPPDLIFDHLDRISHIDSLVLKIKYDKLQF